MQGLTVMATIAATSQIAASAATARINPSCHQSHHPVFTTIFPIGGISGS